MFFRLFFALCFVALFAVAINANNAINAKAEEALSLDVLKVSVVQDHSIQDKVVAKIIVKIADDIIANCALEAGKQCKEHWKNPAAVIECAKDFFKAKIGCCAADK